MITSTLDGLADRIVIFFQMPKRKYSEPQPVTKYKKKKNAVFKPQRYLKTGFPKTTKVKLRYCATVSLNPGLGTTANHVFRANGLYDPDQTGIGHQPMGFDQWSTFYNHYVVESSKMNAEFFYSSTTAVDSGIVCGIMLSDDATVPTGFYGLIEQPTTVYNSMQATHPMTRRVMCSKNFKAKEFFNIKDVIDNTSRIGAAVNATPIEVAAFVVWASSVEGTVDPPPITALITMDYVVTFSEPKELPMS